MKTILLLVALLFIICGCREQFRASEVKVPEETTFEKHKTMSKATWTDGKAEFNLFVSGGEETKPIIARIRIKNLTHAPLSFPTPFVMPLCGDTNKNSIRVYDESGNALGMTGLHADFASRPTSKIPAMGEREWNFTLDDSFPALTQRGKYEVRLWYFSDQHDPATWKGRVEMAPVYVIRK